MLNDGSIVTCLSNPSSNKLSLCKIHYDTYQFVYFTYKLIQKEFEFVHNSEENCLFVKNLHIFLDFIFQKNIRMDTLTQIIFYIEYHSSLKSSIKDKIKKQWPVAHLRNVTTTKQQVTGTSRCVFKSMLNDGSIVTCLSNPSSNKLSLCKIHYDTYQFVYFTYKLIQKEFEFVNNSEENCLFVKNLHIFLDFIFQKNIRMDTLTQIILYIVYHSSLKSSIKEKIKKAVACRTSPECYHH